MSLSFLCLPFFFFFSSENRWQAEHCLPLLVLWEVVIFELSYITPVLLLAHLFCFWNSSVYRDAYLVECFDFCFHIHTSNDFSCLKLLPMFSFSSVSLFTYLCVVGKGAHDALCLWRSEDNLQESVLYLLPLCGFQGLNSDHQVWWQVPFFAEPSCQPF